MRLLLTNDHDDDVLASAQVSISSRKQPGTAEPSASTDLVRNGQGVYDALPMLRQQIWRPFGDVTLPLLCQINLTLQIGARKSAHHRGPP
jgi:hypothetical protein